MRECVNDLVNEGQLANESSTKSISEWMNELDESMNEWMRV